MARYFHRHCSVPKAQRNRCLAKPRMVASNSGREMSFGKTLRFVNLSGNCAAAGMAANKAAPNVIHFDRKRRVIRLLREFLFPVIRALWHITWPRSTLPRPKGNALRVKGGGEAGITPSSAVLMNAVIDALSDTGIEHMDMPATPERVWNAIRAARNGAMKI